VSSEQADVNDDHALLERPLRLTRRGHVAAVLPSPPWYSSVIPSLAPSHHAMLRLGCALWGSAVRTAPALGRASPMAAPTVGDLPALAAAAPLVVGGGARFMSSKDRKNKGKGQPKDQFGAQDLFGAGSAYPIPPLPL